MSNIVFPLNLTTKSFGLPDGESINEFKEMLKKSAGERNMIENTSECYLAIEGNRREKYAEKEGYLMLALCFGINNEKDEITGSDIELKEALKYLDKSKNNPYEIFTHNMKILGQAYPKLKPKFKKISLKEAEEKFKKTANSSTLLFRTKIRMLAYETTNFEFRENEKYKMFSRIEEKDELMANDGHSYLLIVECEEYLNLGVIHSSILEYESEYFQQNQKSNQESKPQNICEVENKRFKKNTEILELTAINSKLKSKVDVGSEKNSNYSEIEEIEENEGKNKPNNSAQRTDKNNLNKSLLMYSFFNFSEKYVETPKCNCFWCNMCCIPPLTHNK